MTFVFLIYAALKGDIDANNVINAQDLQLEVNVILGTETNPVAPMLLSSTSNYGGQALDVTGSLAFLAKPAANHVDATGGVYVLDVSIPTQPILLDQIIVPGLTRTVVATPTFVYTGDSSAIIDVIQLGP